MVLKVFAILSMVAATGATLIMLVMLMAGGANAKPSHILILKWLMWGTTLTWLLCTGGSIWALVSGRPGISTAVALVPIVVIIGIVVVMVKTEF